MNNLLKNPLSMKFSIVALALLALGTSALQGGSILTDTDFSKADTPVVSVDEPGKKISGILPNGWGDDSGFNKEIDLSYEKMEEAGIKFLRIKRGNKGHAQIRFNPNRSQRDTAVYKITIRARTPDSRNFHAIMIATGEKSPWRSDVHLTAEWAEHVFEFVGPPTKEAPYFQFQLPGSSAGSVDLARITIERTDRVKMIEEMKLAVPDGGSPGNRAPVTRFPLGRPPAWVLSRDLDDAEATLAADPKETSGPSGLPALKFEAPEVGRFFSSPIPIPWSFDDHTLSVSVKAAAPGKILILKGGDPRNLANILASGEFFARPDRWQRVTIPFTPQLRGKVHLMAVESKGPVWIDAVQLEYGKTAGAWITPTAEVALALPDSEASVAGIQFLDEPAKVRLALMGPLPSGMKIFAKVTDLYGKETPLPPITAKSGAKLEVFELELPARPDRPIGMFRVEAFAGLTPQKSISPVAEILVTRLPRPKFWGKDAPDSPFGIHVNPTRRDLILAKATGHNWARLHDTGNNITSWWYVEPEQGKWTWRDALLKKYRDRNLLVLGMLSTSPGWANGSPGTSFWDHAYLQPQNLEAWDTYVREVTTHYGNDVAAWEIWNEPWLTTFWRRWDPDKLKESPRGVRDPLDVVAKGYVELTHRAVRVAAETNPGKLIFGFNATGDHEGVEWVKAILAGGGMEAPAPTGFSYHSYVGAPAGFPGDPCFTNGLPLVSGPLRDLHDGKLPLPAWMTEGGSNRDSTRDGFWKWTPGYENKDDWKLAASEEVRYRVSTLAAGGDKMFLYAMHGFDVFNGTDASASFIEVKSNGGGPHPSAVADAVLAWQIEGLKFDRPLDLAPGVFAFVFSDGTKSVAIISTAPQFSPWKLAARPESWECRDMWGNSAPGEASDTLLYLSAGLKPDEMANILKAASGVPVSSDPKP